MERVGAVVVAAGSSRRMGGVDKLWLPLGELPLLARTIANLTRAAEIEQVVVVSTPEGIERVESLRAEPPWNRITRLVVGGRERPDSVYAGLVALGSCDLVLVHDGARPLVAPALVARVLEATRRYGAAVPALAVTDTVKEVDAGGFIVATPDRARLRAVQTPQGFRYELLRRAHEQAGSARATCTDDAMLLERAGLPVATVDGDPRNLKVSTPADLPLIALYMQSHEADVQ